MLTRDFPTGFGERRFFDEDVFDYAEHAFNLKMPRVNVNAGTPIDAPLLPQGACVARNAGGRTRLGSPGFRNADGEGKMHVPGFRAEAAQMLLEEAEVVGVGVGVDTLPIGHGLSGDFIAHCTWRPADRWAVETIQAGSVSESLASSVQ